MFSGITKFLIDANAIRGISVATFNSKMSNNRILASIPEVKEEVPNLGQKLNLLHLENLNKNAFEVMEKIIQKSSVRAVIDYPLNKGAADVALLAHALTSDVAGMFRDEIIIVTNDKKLKETCGDLGLQTMSSDEFKRI